MGKTDLPTGLIIGSLLIVIVFLINENENVKKKVWIICKIGGCILSCLSCMSNLS